MSPRLLFFLSVLCAGAGFAGVRYLAPSNSLGGPAGLSKQEMPEGCETCKHTPSNRFGMMAQAPASHVQTQLSLREMAAQATREGGARTVRVAMMERISALSLRDLEQLIDGEMGSLDFAGMNSPDFKFAVRRLAEMAPEKMADLWAGKNVGRFDASLYLGDWIRKDPLAFLTWNAAQSKEVQKASGSVLERWARESPAEFARFAPQLSAGQGMEEGAKGAVAALLEKDKAAVGAAYEYAQALPEGSLRDAALVELLRISGSDALSRPGVTEALTKLPSEEAVRLGRDLAQVADSLPAGPLRDSAFASAFRKQSKDDPAVAAQKLESIAGTADYPAAVRGFVESTVAKDPAAAAEWALSIGSQAAMHRGAALEKVASTWFKADPKAARAWVEGAQLADAEYFQLTGRQRAR